MYSLNVVYVVKQLIELFHYLVKQVTFNLLPGPATTAYHEVFLREAFVVLYGTGLGRDHNPEPIRNASVWPA